MFFCQPVFGTSDYQFFLDDTPLPLAALIGCTETIRNTVGAGLYSAREHPVRLRLTQHESIGDAPKKKGGPAHKHCGGVMKLSWPRKHQEQTFGCAVLLIDWDAEKAPDRLAFEHRIGQQLDAARAYLGIPSLSNTKLVVALITAALGIGDPAPSGGYASIEEAQSSLRSRLGVGDRGLCVLYSRGRDQYSVQRLDNMIMEHVARYHRDEVARLKKSKGDVADGVTAAAAHAGAGADTQHLQSLLVARTRFKIAWHATAARDMKTARRSWEKCYNALHSLPTPLPMDHWVVATIALWRLITSNLAAAVTNARADPAAVLEQIEANMQAFMLHVDWVTDHSFRWHVDDVASGSRGFAPCPGEPTPALNMTALSPAQQQEVLMREWFLCDFHLVAAERLEQLREFTPRDAQDGCRGKMVCLPSFHYLAAARCMRRILLVLHHAIPALLGVAVPAEGAAFDLAVPQNATGPAPAAPMFIGAEHTDSNNFRAVVARLSPPELTAQIRDVLQKASNCLQPLGLRRQVAALQLDFAAMAQYDGAHGEALQRLNRLAADVSLSKWRELTTAVHAARVRACTTILSGTPDGDGEDDANPNTTRRRSHREAVSGRLLDRGDVLRSMLLSQLHLVVNSVSSATLARRRKLDLIETIRQFPHNDAIYGGAPAVKLAPLIASGPSTQPLSTRSPSAVVSNALIAVFVHFTRPFVESSGAEPVTSGDPVPSAGLTISFECSSAIPVRLYDVEVVLSRVLATTGELGARNREELPRRIHLARAADGSAFPTHCIEMNVKQPLWSTTIPHLDMLPQLDAATIEVTRVTARLLLVAHNQSSSVASVAHLCDPLPHGAAKSTSAAQGLPPSHAANSCESLFVQVPPPEESGEWATLPLHFPVGATIDDAYVSLFEEQRLDTAENRVHRLLTDTPVPQTRSRSGITYATASGHTMPRSSSFARTNPTPDATPLATAQLPSRRGPAVSRDLSWFPKVLALESHRAGAATIPGAYFLRLHRPVVRVVKPVPQLLMCADVGNDDHVVEGDDFTAPITIKSQGDAVLNGKLFVAYIPDVLELIEASLGPDGRDAGLQDVTGTSAEVVQMTPPGYRMACLEVPPGCLGAAGDALTVRLDFRCLYGGFFEVPTRLYYATPKCASMEVAHMVRVHVCRPFATTFAFHGSYASHRDEHNAAAAMVAAPPPTLIVPPYTAVKREPHAFDPFGDIPLPRPQAAEDALAPPPTAPAPPRPETFHSMSEYTTITFTETQRLMPVERFGELQLAAERDGRGAAGTPILHRGALRMLAAQHGVPDAAAAASIGDRVRGSFTGDRRSKMKNLFYHVDLSVVSQNSRGGGGQVDAGAFSLRTGVPACIRLRFTNIMRCPVSVDAVTAHLHSHLQEVHTPAVPQQVVPPGAELTLLVIVMPVRPVPPTQSLGSVSLHVRRASDAAHTLCGGGLPLTFSFPLPNVSIVEQCVRAVVDVPTVAFVTVPVTMRVEVTNTSAVPTGRLRVAISGASLDKYFIAEGRLQTTITVGGFETHTVELRLYPVLPGVTPIPLVEVVSTEGDVIARTQDLRSILIHPKCFQNDQ